MHAPILYPEMKDSGVEWIGKIPTGWKVRRGKTILSLLQRDVLESDDIVTCFRDGEVTLRKNRREDGFTNAMKEIGYQGVEPGDLIVHGMDGFAGAIGISDSRGKASPVLNIMDSTENKRFLMYYLRALSYKDVFLALSTGIRVRSCDLRWNKLANLMYVLPPRTEQDEIVSHLDRECAKVDQILVDVQKSIELYRQWKESIIYEAVTKGIYPEVEMKDSGIAWIGKIPTHWTCCKQKYVINLLNGRAYKDSEFKVSGKYPVLRVGNLFTNSKWYYSSLELDESKYCNNGDLLYAWSASYGPHIWNGEKVIYHYHIWKTELSDQLDKLFTFYYLHALSRNIAAESHGSAMAHVTMEKMNNSYIVYPPVDEQRRIADHLATKCKHVDELIQQKQNLINDLDAYKKSLIYEVVTGKRKVV